MRLRDLLTSGVALAVAVVHFAVQWYGWKLHIDELALPDTRLAAPAEYLWSVCSFPLFALVPGRMQYLYFFELLLANSAIWGGACAWALQACLGHVERRQRRGHVSSTPVEPPAPTKADRLVELRRLLQQGLITPEEFQRKRTTILSDL